MKLFYFFIFLVSAGLLSAQTIPMKNLRVDAAIKNTYDIQQIIDQISADSIKKSLDTLVYFYTRHTNSDTVSQFTGVGAARRWAYSKLQEYSAESGGRLITQYFDFNATILGLTRLNRNVMAILPGTMPVSQNRIFVISGHIDSRNGNLNDFTGFAPSANDDGSGTALMVELVRVMSKYQFDATLVFMIVVGEDEGLYGSAAYANWARQNNLDIEGMVTNDVVGNIVGDNGIIDSMSVRHFSSVVDTTMHRQMARIDKIIGEKFLPGFTVTLIPAEDRPGRGGDHQSFQAVNYTATRFTEPNEYFAHQHSFDDLIQYMNIPFNARITKLNAACFANLAWAPKTPEKPVLQDVGNGTQVKVKWNRTNTEPDFGGYRIAIRDSGALFYKKIISAGNVTEFLVDSLTQNSPVWISISAVDTSGYESIFSKEVRIVPRTKPSAPQGLNSTSKSNSVTLQWNKNNELDIKQYKIFRGQSAAADFTLIDSTDQTVTTYTDLNVLAHNFYYYKIQAIDNDGNISDASSVVKGRLATHDLGIYVVDATRHGFGSVMFPKDSTVDNYYKDILQDFFLAGEWDAQDSVTKNVSLDDADLAVYSPIVWHSDIVDGAAYLDSTTIRKYMENGGKVVFTGWKLFSSLTGSHKDTVNFAPNSFVRDLFFADQILVSGNTAKDFKSAQSILPGYPDIKVDSVKTASLGGRLNNMEIINSIEPNALPLYKYVSDGNPSGFEGKYISARTNSPGIVYFDFPFYFMEKQSAREVLSYALRNLGAVTSVKNEDNSKKVPDGYTLLQNYPNPFNPTTNIRFGLPEGAHVTLTIYNQLGERVATILNKTMDSGFHSVTWNSANLSSGIYFYELKTDKISLVKKLMLLK